MATEVIEAPVQNGLSAGEKRHLGALEKRIANGLQTFREVGQALLEIRDSRLYRESHATFEAYCTERWAMPRARAYQLIDSAKVVNVLGDPEELTNEAQARELAVLTDPATMKTVWQAAETRAEKENRPVTAALIRQVRSEVVTPDNVARAETPTDRLMASIGRIVTQHAAWKATKPSIGERNKVKAAFARLSGVMG